MSVTFKNFVRRYVRGSLIALVGLLLAQAARAQVLNGVGEFTELGQQVFIATLHTQQPTSDARELLSRDLASAMSVRITARRVSQKRFITLWLESLSVNADSELLLAHVNRLGRFGNFFKGALRSGDLLVLDYAPGKGLAVRLNEVPLGSIEGPEAGEFYRLLLRGWIGDIPLSSQFRNALLTPADPDKSLLADFSNVTFSPQRQSTLRQWRLASQHTVVEPPSQIVAERGSEPVESATAQAAEKNNVVPSASKKPEQQPQATVAKSQTPPKPPVTESLVKKRVVQAPAEFENPEEPDDDADDKDVLVMDEQLLVIRQQYYARVSGRALKYQTLPRQAFQRRIEGEVRVQVVLDRSGQVVRTQLAEASPHAFFNKQALGAVREAAPFAPMPAELLDEEFIFTVPFRYRLPY